MSSLKHFAGGVGGNFVESFVRSFVPHCVGNSVESRFPLKLPDKQVYDKVHDKVYDKVYDKVGEWLLISLLIFGGLGSTNRAIAADRRVIALSDSARPALVKAIVVNGSITVKGYDGKDVVVESDQPRLQVSESDNEVTVQPAPGAAVDLRLSVPFKTSLELKCVTGGNIQVEKVEGEIEVNGSNASINLRKVSGVVVAHSLQGRVLAQMDALTPGKPMSFTTMNGDVEVSLPPDTKAEVNLQTLNGSIRSDFALSSHGSAGLRSMKILSGAINGGGPEIQLKALNGSVTLKKNSK